MNIKVELRKLIVNLLLFSVTLVLCFPIVILLTVIDTAFFHDFRPPEATDFDLGIPLIHFGIGLIVMISSHYSIPLVKSHYFINIKTIRNVAIISVLVSIAILLLILLARHYGFLVPYGESFESNHPPIKPFIIGK